MSSSGNEAFYSWPSPDEPAREVYYSIVTHPTEPIALWHRYTLVRTADGGEARVWAAVTDARADGQSVFLTESTSLSAVDIDDDTFSLSIGSIGRLTDGAASGHLEDGDRSVSWSLEYTPDTYTFTPIDDEGQMVGMARNGDAGVHWSANQSVAMSGSITVDGEDISLENAPGHQGHTAGRSAPEFWVWVHCNAFEDRSVSLETLTMDDRLSTGVLRRDGAVQSYNRTEQVVGDTVSTSVNEPGRWEFSVDADDIAFEATAVADEDHWQLASYLTPDGSLRYNAHCSLATVDLLLADGTTHHSTAGRIEWVQRRPPVSGEYPPFEAALDSSRR